MFFSVGYVLLAVVRWLNKRRRKNMYLQAVRQALRNSSIYITKSSKIDLSARSLISSSLLDKDTSFTQKKILKDDRINIATVEPQQVVNLKDWTSYRSQQGVYHSDRSQEDVMLLIEAVRPSDVDSFIKHELEVAPVEKVHFLAHGAAVAWKPGTPFGILMHCTVEEFINLSMAYCDGILTMDEDLEVCSILSVKVEGKSSSALQQTTSSDLHRVASKDGCGDICTSEQGDGNADLWSNESLASNSSIGRTSMLDMDNISQVADDENEELMMESGSGEGLSEDVDLGASSSTGSGSLSQSWKIVRSASVSKPPNVLIYTGKIDSIRKFEKVRTVIEHCLDIDCYVVYHLKHEDLISTPWIENTVLLIIATKKNYSDANEQFLKYFQSGGKILGFGSGFDQTLVGQKQLRSDNWITSFNYKSWTDISLVSGYFAYNYKEVAIDNCHISDLAKDKDGNVVIVKCDQETKKSPGCAVLSQVLFDRNAGDFGVTPDLFNTLKKYNTARFEILEQLLTVLGLECNVRTPPKFTPVVLITKTEKLKEGFMRSIQNRLSSGILKYGTQSMNFTTDITEPVTDTVLPVIIEENDEVMKNFNKKIYCDNLQSKVLGNTLLYVDVVPTTMTLLDGLMFSVPADTGLIVVARQQTSGKGRGGNSWLSPIGCAMFTLHVRIPQDSALGRSVSYLQHITSLAVVHSVCKLPGYEDIDLRLKWPNDIYYGKQMKLGGVIVKSTFMDGMVHALIGCGFNVDNSNPTICINDVIQLCNRQEGGNIKPCSTLQLIARTVSNIESLIDEFQQHGPESFKKQYYDSWIHSDQKVKLQSEDYREVTIKGLDDFGYLLVKDENGKEISVTDDGNSFDMMKNLISMKTR
ncbi:hypothetical protein ACF0H5_007625 [Mactra antiquata]